MTDIQDLDSRKAAILEAVVTEYIGTAQPVGSHHVARAPGINVSSATIRSEMVALERDGYLAQPHTSAGRIPTDKGYRFFVDQLTEPGVLGPAQRQKVSRFFEQVHGEMEEMLERTSGLLSDLTSYASVVLSPGHEAAAVRSVQLVGLGPRVALLVVVLADGAVEKRSIDLTEEVPDEVLAAASARVQAAAQSRPLGALIAPEPSGDATVDRVVALAQSVLEDFANEVHDRVFVGGPSRLAAAFDAVETVRGVLQTLEQQLVVVSLLRDVLERGLSVAIGAEHGYEPLSSCAVVVTPVSVDGQAAGAVGLLGPTRMNYPEALAAARVVSEHLGQRLGGTLESGSPGAPSPAPSPTGAAAGAGGPRPRRRARGRR
ncbi:MAG TPA: heat-inducible transcriptional repressor HrcA [Acidimicrobiales bacterium]|nr:heat-inducible transcriptional repressor HrcA [Acidimicrobiales bacterium]